MSDIDTLHDRLRSLVQVAAPVSGRERVLIAAGGSDALAAMRLEVCETQLPRRIIFRADQNREITFDVASGRIFKIAEPTSPSLFKGLEGSNLMDEFLETDGCATQVARLIDAFITDTKTLTVETQFLREPINSLNFGISAHAVFSASCLSESETQNPQKGAALTEFSKACSAFSIAGLVMEGTQAKFEFGAEDDLGLLRKILLAETSQGANSSLMQVDPENDSHCAIYSGHPTRANSILCASHANDLALVIFENADLDRILELAKF